jgi:nitrate reductase NapE component
MTQTESLRKVSLQTRLHGLADSRARVVAHASRLNQRLDAFSKWVAVVKHDPLLTVAAVAAFGFLVASAMTKDQNHS